MKRLGQADARYKFIARGATYSLLLMPDEAVLVSNELQRSDLGLLDRKSDGSSAVPEHPQSQVRNRNANVLRMKFVGASSSARIVGLDTLPVKSNYFIGNGPGKWRTNVPNYARVKREGVYPGIDILYGNQGQFEYDLIVAPGACLNPKVHPICEEAGKKVDPGQSVQVRVRNSNGVLSQSFSNTRPAN